MFKLWGGEASDSSCQSHLLDGTPDSTAVSQSSRCTFFTSRWWHVELQPTADAYFWVDTWWCTCILDSCPLVYRCTYPQKTCPFILRIHILCYMVLPVFLWMSSNFSNACEVWGSKLPTGILPCKGLASSPGCFPLINEFVLDILYLWRSFWAWLSKGLLLRAKQFFMYL